jgi:hypothetical protein
MGWLRVIGVLLACVVVVIVLIEDGSFGIHALEETPTGKRRLIFSINTGRCGSGYMYSLLRTAKGTSAVHEGFPAMAGPQLKAVKEKGLEVSVVQCSVV